ncbi:MAG: uroporphyrinogen-III synthase [Qingshengfaniella sp.]
MPSPDPGLRMLLTRPEDPARRFAALSRARLPGLRVVIAPLMRIVPVAGLPSQGEARGLIFTSASGVQAFSGLGGRSDLPVHCVGRATARAARASGLAVGLVAQDAQGLIAQVIQARPPAPLLHLHGRHVSGQVAADLTAGGIPTTAAILYDQIAQPLPPAGRNALRQPGPMLVPVFSPRSARLLFPWIDGAIATLRIAAISPAVSNVFAAQGLPPPRSASRPEAGALVDLMSELAISMSS